MKIHAGRDEPPRIGDGRCSWHWAWEDVVLWCSDNAIPGSNTCADHLIEFEHAMADAGIPPATPPAVAAERDRLGLS